jgi:hypothetical protein
MSIAIGIWIALAGFVSVVVGLSGLRRVRRLRRDGVKAWAVGVPMPLADEEGRVALQYTLADGRVIEKLTPAATGKAALRPGQSVLVWYDPADPLDVLVHGRDRRVQDLVFAVTGAVFLLGGLAMALLPRSSVRRQGRALWLAGEAG